MDGLSIRSFVFNVIGGWHRAIVSDERRQRRVVRRLEKKGRINDVTRPRLELNNAGFDNICQSCGVLSNEWSFDGWAFVLRWIFNKTFLTVILSVFFLSLFSLCI